MSQKSSFDGQIQNYFECLHVSGENIGHRHGRGLVVIHGEFFFTTHTKPDHEKLIS